jgi:hypothetical protein
MGRVAIYPADLNGKTSDVELRRTCGFQLRGDSGLGIVPFVIPITPQPSRFSCDDHSFKLSYLAAQSGGSVFHGAQKVHEAMTRAASDESTYYTLTYSPANTKLDGTVREIKITLGQKNYHLAYRKGYYADDPSTLNRPETKASPDLYLPNPQGPLPWKAIRFSDLIPAPSDDSKDPIVAALRYGAPESNDAVFTAHVEPTDKLVRATSEQMDQLQDYESFRTERIENAMENLTREQRRSQHKGRTVLDTLPLADPVFLQPYSIDYSLPGKQLSLTRDAHADHAFHLEVAILAYDALGKRVTGLKDTVSETISAADLQQFQSSDYKIHETLQIPDRVTRLRLAVRDVDGNHLGSLEVPVWAISSPYKRKRLEPPAALPDDHSANRSTASRDQAPSS